MNIKKISFILLTIFMIFFASCDLLSDLLDKPQEQRVTSTPETVKATAVPTPPPNLSPVRAPSGGIMLTILPQADAPETPKQDLTGLVINELSGLYISEEAAKRRPFAIVFNNAEKALPQSGLSQADIIYEVLAEGSITRIIGIFQDFDSAKIGSIRSARHYFLDFALDHDAFFVHFGGSPQAYSAISDLKINNLNGIYLDGGVKTSNFSSVVFWRDAERYRTSSMREHSAYTNAENLIRQAQKSKFRMEKRAERESMFNFYTSPSNYDGAKSAVKITVPYISATNGIFEYNAETKKYKRYQLKNKSQIDGETGQQIEVDNVIVQITTVRTIAGDDAGRREVTLVGSGSGFLYTNGTEIPIKWRKTSHNSPTVWTYENGEKLTLNKGKTWICVTNKAPETVR